MRQPNVTLDHSVIHVSNWETAREFYTRVLGAEAVPVRKGYAFRFGQQQLNCHGPEQIGNPVARIPVAPGNSDLCFCWPGPIDGAIAHLKACSVPIELGPVERFGARGPGTSVYFATPTARCSSSCPTHPHPDSPCFDRARAALMSPVSEKANTKWQP
jgi:catechol 2,3-dioxygenase-like lactoylglutathione lyase family enzyme